MAMTRSEALERILQAFPDDPIVVTLGTTSREMIALSQAPLHLHVLDSMGLAPAIGLGIALGVGENAPGKVVVLEGDGGMLMGLSTLATIGLLRPKNLVLLILDNGTYGATGGQPTASEAVDLCAVARGCGIAASNVEDLDGLDDALADARTADGPRLLRIAIDQTTRKLPFYLADPVLLAARFAESLRR